MNKTIKQHYVPRFYLKNFANNIKKEYFTYCYDIRQNKCYPANIMNIGEEKYFYKIGDQDFEEDFQKIEKLATPIINNLSKYKKIKPLLNIENRSRLSIFMTIQFLRTKEMRKSLTSFNSKISEYLQKFELSEEMDKFNKFLNEEYIKHHHINAINESMNSLAPMFLFKKWILIKNKTEIPFWTSDNPIVRYNPQGNIGLESDYIHIFFPINPKLCLCLVDPTKYINFNELNEFTGEAIIFNIKKITSSKITDEKKINKINYLQLKFATRHLFSKYDDYSNVSTLIKNNINPIEKERVKMEILKNPKNDNEVLHFYHLD